MYDIIICGGGPAGLSIGSEISSKLKILIIEKSKCGETTHSWATWKENAKGIPILYKSKEGLFSSYLGAEAKVEDALTYTVDDKKTLSLWLKKCKKNKVKIIENCTFESYDTFKDRIKIKTSKGDFESRLLIDAMGENSLIVNKINKDKNTHHWSCFGYVVDNTLLDSSKSLIFENVFLGSPRTCFMYFPISKKRFAVTVFFLGHKKYEKIFMKKKFFEVIKSGKYKDKFRNTRYIEEKLGYIPLRRKPLESLDRILFVGDAAGWAPALSGCGFNIIVSKYKEVSKNIVNTFEKNDFSKKNLNKVFQLTDIEEKNHFGQFIAYYLIINSSDEELNKFFLWFNSLDLKYKEHMIKSSLTITEIEKIILSFLEKFGLRMIIKMIKYFTIKDYMIIMKKLRKLKKT